MTLEEIEKELAEKEALVEQAKAQMYALGGQVQLLNSLRDKELAKTKEVTPE